MITKLKRCSPKPDDYNFIPFWDEVERYFNGFPMEKCVALLSGGLNSAVALASSAEKYQLYPLFANLHQRPMAQESKCFDRLCSHFEAQHPWKVELPHFKQVGGNAFTDLKREIEDAQKLENDIAGTYVAMMLPTLLDVAASFAFRIGASYILIGVSEALGEPGPGPAVMYPDNRQEFLHNYQYMLEAAIPKRTKIKVLSPLIDFSRSEIIRLGQRFKVPFEHTWSCYREKDSPCGTCYGCANRASGFLQASFSDPLILPSNQETA